jgi:multicomponent Na+:H+ antiporter subunit E
MRLLVLGWMTVLWVVLWRDASPANVLSGLAAALIVVTVFPVRRARARDHTLRPVRLLVFLGYFAWQLVVSNVVVAREILTPRDRVRSGIVAVPVPACSDLVITIVANAITLTPGTLTLEVWRDPATLYVHVLHLDDLDEVRRDIRTLQTMVVRAIGSNEAIRALEATPLPVAASPPPSTPTEDSP